MATEWRRITAEALFNHLKHYETQSTFTSIYGFMNKIISNIVYEAYYDATGYRGFQRSVWICPVTPFVMGRNLKNIYVIGAKNVIQTVIYLR